MAKQKIDWKKQKIKKNIYEEINKDDIDELQKEYDDLNDDLSEEI